jgi:hypothetical protein
MCVCVDWQIVTNDTEEITDPIFRVGVHHMRFKVITSVNITVTVSRDVTPYSLLDRYHISGGTCYFHGIYPEDRGSGFLRKSRYFDQTPSRERRSYPLL